MSKKTILVVEDEWSARETLRQRLEFEGYDVEVADDGEDAIEKVKNIDLIILDIMMPKINGFQFARKIKEIEDFQEIPIIFITAKSQESDKFWAKNIGAQAFIEKPYDIKEVLETVKKHIPNKAMERKEAPSHDSEKDS